MQRGHCLTPQLVYTINIFIHEWLCWTLINTHKHNSIKYRYRRTQTGMQATMLPHKIRYFQYEPISCSGCFEALYLGKSSSCHSSFTSMFSILRVASVVPIPQRGELGLEVWQNPLSIGHHLQQRSEVKSPHEINPHKHVLNLRRRNQHDR